MLHLLLLSTLVAQAGEPKTPAPPPGFQWKLVEHFSAERCDLIRSSTSSEMYDRLRPNVRAIVAFCEPRDADPEALFASAERDDPTGDLILVLHAKWTWKRDRERARPLWDKVLKLARNESLRAMAERYLSDQVEKDEILHLTKYSYQGKARLGGGFESDPTLPLAPQPLRKTPEGFGVFALDGGLQRWYPFGSISLNYDGSYHRYLGTPNLSFLANQAELPVSLRLGDYEDIVFRPFYGISLAGPREYGARYGLGVRGVAYRPDYKQSVEGSIFSERLLDPTVKPEEGTHFRFEYDWEFFPGQWIYRFQGLMEHVRAVDDFSNGTNLKFTHTDVGCGFQVQFLQREISYEAGLRATMRLDSLASGYTSTITGGPLSKRRNDFTLAFRPAVTVPLGHEIALNASYELDRIWSPVGHPGDYADYNIFDQKGELVLVTEFTNY